MNIQRFLLEILQFLNDAVIPFLIAIAFLFFLWNATKYFIIQSDTEEGRRKARQLALWGIIAFVVIVSIWGITNLFVEGLDIDRERDVTPDFIEEDGGYFNVYQFDDLSSPF